MIPYQLNAIFKENNFLESSPSFWIMRSQRSRRRDKGLLFTHVYVRRTTNAQTLSLYTYSNCPLCIIIISSCLKVCRSQHLRGHRISLQSYKKIMCCFVIFSTITHPQNVVYDMRKCWPSQIILDIIFYMTLH